MKKILLLTSIFCASLLITSCSSDDDCGQDAWIGTYTLTSEAECDLGDNTSVTADPMVVITAGSTENSLDLAGTEVTIDEETCSVTALFITVSLDGDVLTSNFGEGCVFTYERN